jgi:dTDP-D-glucose 4,6-dehydratase
VDIAKIERIARWHPKKSLREGLAKTIDCYQANRAHYWSLGACGGGRGNGTIFSVHGG